MSRLPTLRGKLTLAGYGALHVRYQKKEEGSENVILTILGDFRVK